MKIHIAKFEPNRIGGGWSFANNFYKGFGQTSYDEADFYFIPSASMVTLEEVEKAFDDSKKIVLRIDNATRNSRNKRNGMDRLLSKALIADVVIFQSQWAKNFLLPFLNQTPKKFDDSPVILNGVDTSVYTDDNKGLDDTFLYARSSRDEGKGWINAWYWFVNNPGRLEIVGKFSPENLDHNFDFFNGERYRFMGEQQNMADVYRRNKHFLYSYWFDACSNTLLEARASGCQIIDVHGALKTGGAPEIMACEDISLERMLKEYSEVLYEL